MTLNGIAFTATEDIEWTGTVIGNEAEVTDGQGGLHENVSDGDSWDIPDGDRCSTNPADYAGDGNYTGTESNTAEVTFVGGNDEDSARTDWTCRAALLKIIKYSGGASGTFNFTVVNGTPIGKTITTNASGNGDTGWFIVTPGQKTVGETGPGTGWKLVGSTCQKVFPTPAATVGGGLTDTSPADGFYETWRFNISVGQLVECRFENAKTGVTRTQGFWATHTRFANLVWTGSVPAADKEFCSAATTRPVPNLGVYVVDADATSPGKKNELMGGLWSSISKKTVGGSRTAIDQARMQVLQQMLAAMLNKYGLGTDPGIGIWDATMIAAFGADPGDLIAEAKLVYCAPDATADYLTLLKKYIGKLGSFNESGHTLNIDNAFYVPGATPSDSKKQANLAFWDVTK